MLRKVISIPEGVYYRGRFRATVAWPNVGRRKGEGDSVAADEKDRHTIQELDEPLPLEAVSGKAKTAALHK
jgi:hypothetical protein